MVLLQWHQWLFDHHTLHVSWLFQHLLKFMAMVVFDCVGNKVSACEAGLVGGLAAGTAEEERSHRPDGFQCCYTFNGEMERRVACLILDLEFRMHRQDVGDCKLGLLIARPVKWGAAFVVNCINVDFVDHGEVVQTDRLVSLGSNMETVSAINVCNIDICAHFLHHQLD